MQLLADWSRFRIDRFLFRQRDIVEITAQGEVVGLAPAALHRRAHTSAGVVKGRRALVQSIHAHLERLIRPPPVGQVEFEIKNLLNVVQPGGQGGGVSHAQQIVVGPLGVDTRTLDGRIDPETRTTHACRGVEIGARGGGIGGAELQGPSRSFHEADDYRARTAFALLLGRKCGGGRVEDAGIGQSSLEAGQLVGPIDLARTPGGQGTHEGGPGVALVVDPHLAQPDSRAGLDAERRAHGAVGVIDNHLTRQGRGVGVAQPGQGDHRSGLGRQDVEGAPGCAGLQRHRLVGRPRRRGGRRRAGPLDDRSRQLEARTEHHRDHRFGRVGLGDVGADVGLIVSLGAKVRGGGVGRVTGAPARFDPALRRGFHLADGPGHI